jgi:hypothetical protein
LGELRRLGELELEIPDYVKMEQDPETGTATLSILNIDEKQQHEMWGTFPSSSPPLRRAKIWCDVC